MVDLKFKILFLLGAFKNWIDATHESKRIQIFSRPRFGFYNKWLRLAENGRLCHYKWAFVIRINYITASNKSFKAQTDSIESTIQLNFLANLRKYFIRNENEGKKIESVESELFHWPTDMELLDFMFWLLQGHEFISQTLANSSKNRCFGTASQFKGLEKRVFFNKIYKQKKRNERLVNLDWVWNVFSLLQMDLGTNMDFLV